MKKGTKKGAYPGLTRDRNSGVFRFKLDLPKDVRSHFDVSSVVVSLGRDEKIAVEKWGPLHAEWRAKIREIREGTLRALSDDRIDQFAASILAPESHPYLSDDLTQRVTRFFHSTADMTAAIDAELPKLAKGHRVTEADRKALLERMTDQYLAKLRDLARLSPSVAVAVKKSQAVTAMADQFNDHPEPPKTDNRKKLADALDAWRNAAVHRPKTEFEFAKSVELFISINGDLALDEITADHFRAFRSHLRSAKSARGGKLATASAHKRFAAVKAIMSRAVDEGLCLANPGADVTIQRGKGSKARQEGWTDDELGKLFGSATFHGGDRPANKGGEALYWIPVLALYLGARQSELAALMKADVFTSNGIRCLSINTDAEGKHLKNSESHRLVPIPAAVWDLGFDRYLASLPEGSKLFPDVKPDTHDVAGGLFSKAFGQLRRDAGITRKAADFHALRHMVKSAIRSIPGDFEVKSKITGHDTGNEGANYGSVSVKDMKAIIDQVAFNVVIPPWRKAAGTTAKAA